jgi:serine/threonine protein kinase
LPRNVPTAVMRPRMTNGNGARLAVGDQVGTFRVVGHLVGNTYRAVHLGTARRVLLEVAPPDNWREVSLQMLRAQQLVESLQHPGIARIVDRGMLVDRRPWMATEVPNGIGIYDVIARREMPARELTALIRDVADVLAYAHGLGVVHRALTLRSLVLATGPRAFPIAIADWGMRSGDIGVYAAPELSMYGSNDGRVDVYSLGVIAFRAATRVFPGEDGVFVMTGVSTGLGSLILRMLAIDPNERPTALEVRALAAQLLVEEPRQLDDIVYPSGPRFSRPRWTPAPHERIVEEPLPDLPLVDKKPS